jgi:hypothetical protein
METHGALCVIIILGVAVMLQQLKEPLDHESRTVARRS